LEDDCSEHDGRPALCATKPYCSYFKGICIMADVAKHSCAAAKDAGSCGLLKDRRGRDMCLYADTCSANPCSACQACLDTANLYLNSLMFTMAVTPIELREPFGQLCKALNVSDALCARVGERIQASAEGNLGRRAGSICSMLGACSRDAIASCSAFTAPAFEGRPGNLTTNLTGTLDLCTIEGVQGGAPLFLSTKPVPPQQVKELGLCLQDGDCPEAGQVCHRQGAGTQVCGCAGGVDVCQSYGSCTSYCRVPSVARQLEALNRMVSGPGRRVSRRRALSERMPGSTARQWRGPAACCLRGPGQHITAGCSPAQSCDPSGDQDTCPAALGSNYQCIVSSGTCSTFACEEATGKITAQSCSGTCRPVDYNMKSAAFSRSKASILVDLNAPAQPGTFQCAAIFDAATMSKLGSSPMCTVTSTKDAGRLSVSLGPDATIIVNDELTLSSQTRLAFISDAGSRFSGSVAIGSCEPCDAPQLRVMGPATVTPPCDESSSKLDLRFDARNSRDSSGRPLRSATWSLGPLTGSLTNVEVGTVADAMAAANSRTAVR
jgi:hypothetical protein